MITDFSTERERVAARLRVALELQRLGIALMRQNLKRKMPGASEEDVDAQLERWLLEEPPLAAQLKKRK